MCFQIDLWKTDIFQMDKESVNRKCLVPEEGKNTKSVVFGDITVFLVGPNTILSKVYLLQVGWVITEIQKMTKSSYHIRLVMIVVYDQNIPKWRYFFWRITYVEW